MMYRSKLTSLSIAILAMAVCLAFGRIESQAQSCGLMVGGYFDSASNTGTVTNIPAAELLPDTAAYAIDLKSGKRYESVSTNSYRNFGEIPAGSYKVYISKSGYKTTIYQIDLDCSEVSEEGVAESIRVWKGRSNQVVDNSNTSEVVKEMRLERLTRLGSTDSDSGSRVVAPDEPYPSGPPSPNPPGTISGGVLNGKALSLPLPPYPPAARAVRAKGSVSVQVLISEDGNVISAHAVSGHPLLRAASEAAARDARFTRTLLAGMPVKVSGIITYNFVP